MIFCFHYSIFLKLNSNAHDKTSLNRSGRETKLELFYFTNRLKSFKTT